MEQLKCPNCGGNVDRVRMTCPYCGTQFKKDEPDVLRIATYTPGTEVLKSYIVLDEMVFNQLGRENASEMIVREMSRKIADALIPFMEVEVQHDLRRLEAHVCSRVRVLRPDYRF